MNCNVSFLCISENPLNLTKCNVSFLCISEYPHELHDLPKDYLLVPERLQIEENILSNYQYQRYKMKDSANFLPSLSQIYTTKQTTSSTTAI